jgi:hypothetical protein
MCAAGSTWTNMVLPITDPPWRGPRFFVVGQPELSGERGTSSREFNGVMAVARLIVVKVGDTEIEVETVQVAGTEATSGPMAKAAERALDAFGRAQEVIIEVARSTAEMIEKAGARARPDRVDVEFGLSFSVSGRVIMAGVAGDASLKVTLGYDIANRLEAPDQDRPESMAELVKAGRKDATASEPNDDERRSGPDNG